MTTPLLYRRRFIPNELISLKNDLFLIVEPDLIVTKWVTLHPRKDIARGISAYYLDKGFKVSKIYDKNDNIIYWYCDIIKAKKETNKNTVIIEDLLIDVLVYEDGRVKIMDLDEFCDALDEKLITQAESTSALRKLHTLLNILYDGTFNEIKALINNAEKLNPLPAY